MFWMMTRTVTMKCGAIDLTSQYTKIAMKNVISCILKNILFIDNSTTTTMKLLFQNFVVE